ncbi:fasciclin domain-containing protein [Niabella sp. W65]|nr:fasciclin domain-containing protein [Niabella sp. W65]MCH7363074.1 fasciclin domain-containing protein [Niabella sp. W65]ULT39005.1 fasciclin domain-containing protein [Niabella sp. I65]
MNILSRTHLAAVILLCIGYCSCSQKWDDHIGLTGPELQRTLYDVIGTNSDYSAFLDLLNKSGYADELKSSKNFTVIVPTNQAIDQVKISYDFNDTSVIRSFVGYHIINSVYNVNESTDTLRVRNLRNKYVEFTQGTFDGVQAQQKTW